MNENTLKTCTTCESFKENGNYICSQHGDCFMTPGGIPSKYKEKIDLEIQSKDVVNHPSHYNRKNGVECIDEMIAMFGEEEVAIWCKLNVWKYRYRAYDKNGEEDLKKSDWNMKKFLELKHNVNYKKIKTYLDDLKNDSITCELSDKDKLAYTE